MELEVLTSVASRDRALIGKRIEYTFELKRLGCFSVPERRFEQFRRR